MKKFISIMLVALMLLSFAACSGNSKSTDVVNFDYYINYGEITISGFNKDCADTDIIIPNTIENYPVTAIGENAFECCTNIKSITIPDSVTNIGNSAFEYCYGLTSITIPDSVTSIGDGAFAVCNGLKSITIPDSVTSISNGAFDVCDNLTKIHVSSSNTSAIDDLQDYSSKLMID